MQKVVYLNLKDYCINKGKEYMLTERDTEKTAFHGRDIQLFGRCSRRADVRSFMADADQ